MKYMGSKKYMLRNGLGKMILSQSRNSKRIVDLFCGAGSVSWFAAENTTLPILAVDLQSYATLYTGAVIERTYPIDATHLKDIWLNKVVKEYRKSSLYKECEQLITNYERNIPKLVNKGRKLCQSSPEVGPIWKAYGGYYFSPKQALLIDLMIKYLPVKNPQRNVCHAAVISAASFCAAAPGHTAQPFQPTLTAGKFLLASWKKDVIESCEQVLDFLCPKHANTMGRTMTKDAYDVIKDLNKDDLIIIDPPYSEVQYSRFYHVLETISRKTCGEVEGVGRYPHLDERPQSEFSMKSKSYAASDKLFKSIADRGSRVIVTFPKNDSSNGLSGKKIESIANKYFFIKKRYVYGVFSTMGGNNGKRASRKKSEELILSMTPR